MPWSYSKAHSKPVVQMRSPRRGRKGVPALEQAVNAARSPRRGRKGAPLLMALLLWVCLLLPLVVWGLPLLGGPATMTVALVLLAGLLAICLAVCGPFERNEEEWRRLVQEAAGRALAKTVPPRQSSRDQDDTESDRP